MMSPGARRTAVIVGQIEAGFTLDAVGSFLSITRERVRQIYTKATGHGVPTRPWTRATRDFRAIRVRRFWVRFQVDENGCWVWVGKLFPTGYGRARYDGGQYAHRIAYTLVKGPIPDGLTIDHLCRNRACGNPAHLEAVTPRENVLRSPIAIAAINARKTHCLHGHEFTVANTGQPGRARGRRCRACARIRSHEQTRRKTAARRALRALSGEAA